MKTLRFTLVMLFVVALWRPAYADGILPGPFDDYIDKWGLGGYPDSDTSVQVKPGDDTPAAQNIQQAIDFLRDIGDTEMADDLTEWFSEGWVKGSKIFRDPNPGGNADTNTVGTITISDSGIGAKNVFDPVKDFDSIVTLARTLTHEMTHVHQNVIWKGFNSIETLNSVQDHEVEGWEVGLDALRRWHDVLWLRYFEEKDPAKKVALAHQLQTVANVEVGTWGDYAENKFYGVDGKQYAEQRAEATENAKYGDMRLRTATQELKRTQEAEAQAKAAEAAAIRAAQYAREQTNTRLRVEAEQKAAQLKAEADAKQEAYRRAVEAVRRAEQDERNRAEAQQLRHDANRLDGPAATSERQENDWRDLERDAREDARRNRERAREWRREGREDWAKEWEEEARRDEAEAARRAEEAKRLEEEARKLRERAKELRDKAAQLSPQQVSQLLPQIHQEVETLLAKAPHSPRADDLEVSLQGENRSAGDIFTCTFTNHSDQTLLAALPVGLVLTPRNGAYQSMIIGQTAAVTLPPGTSSTIKLDGFCLDPGKLPPPAAMPAAPAIARQPKPHFVLVAAGKPAAKANSRRPAWQKAGAVFNWGVAFGPVQQKQMAPYVAIVRAGNEMDNLGKLAPGIQDPKSYRTTVIQRALWLQSTKGTPQQLGKAALQKEIAAQIAKLPAEQRPAPQAQSQAVERIWADVQMVLQMAGLK